MEKVNNQILFSFEDEHCEQKRFDCAIVRCNLFPGKETQLKNYLVNVSWYLLNIIISFVCYCGEATLCIIILLR